MIAGIGDCGTLGGWATELPNRMKHRKHNRIALISIERVYRVATSRINGTGSQTGQRGRSCAAFLSAKVDNHLPVSRYRFTLNSGPNDASNFRDRRLGACRNTLFCIRARLQPCRKCSFCNAALDADGRFSYLVRLFQRPPRNVSRRRRSPGGLRTGLLRAPARAPVRAHCRANRVPSAAWPHRQRAA